MLAEIRPNFHLLFADEWLAGDGQIFRWMVFRFENLNSIFVCGTVYDISVYSWRDKVS